MENEIYDPFAHLKVKAEDIPLVELHNLDAAIALFVAPRLREHIAMQEEMEPCVEGMSWPEWHEVLQKMQFAFDTLEQRTIDDVIIDEKNKDEVVEARIAEGLGLFARYFHCLWV